MERMAVIALAGLLTSCATNATKMLEEGPNATFVSAKTPEAVRDCLYQLAPGRVAVTPYRDGWSVARTDTGPYPNFVQITQEGEGVKVEVYGMRGIRLAAQDCV